MPVPAPKVPDELACSVSVKSAAAAGAVPARATLSGAGRWEACWLSERGRRLSREVTFPAFIDASEISAAFAARARISALELTTLAGVFIGVSVGPPEESTRLMMWIRFAGSAAGVDTSVAMGVGGVSTPRVCRPIASAGFVEGLVSGRA